jgi:hypothetical protein
LPSVGVDWGDGAPLQLGPAQGGEQSAQNQVGRSTIAHQAEGEGQGVQERGDPKHQEWHLDKQAQHRAESDAVALAHPAPECLLDGASRRQDARQLRLWTDIKRSLRG